MLLKDHLVGVGNWATLMRQSGYHKEKKAYLFRADQREMEHGISIDHGAQTIEKHRSSCSKSKK